MIREKANAIYAQLMKIRSEADDKIVSEMPDLLPTLKNDGKAIEAGTAINWKGEVYRAGITLWDRTENDPDHLPEMWDKVMYRDGIRIIPEVIKVTTLFHKNELGWWGDELYKSKVDNNAYTPEQYAPNWEHFVQ